MTLLLVCSPAESCLEGQVWPPHCLPLSNFSPFPPFFKKTHSFGRKTPSCHLPIAPAHGTGESECWKSHLCSLGVKCLGENEGEQLVCSPSASSVGFRSMRTFAQTGERVSPALPCGTLQTPSSFKVDDSPPQERPEERETQEWDSEMQQTAYLGK